MATKETVVIAAAPANKYDVHIGAGASALLGELLNKIEAFARTTVVTDTNAWQTAGGAVEASLEAADIGFDLIALPPGENEKTLDSAAVIFEALTDCGATRREPIIAVGGGVIGDLAGFAASTYMRGVPFVNVPTTLLAMTDSSIGGKTAVDLPSGKNLVGSVYQPILVIDDVEFLETLPDGEMKSGLAEIVKAGFLEGGFLKAFIEDNMPGLLAKDKKVMAETVRRAVHFKADIVGADAADLTGRRAILNYGHTLGHAMETAAGYTGISHGQAVAYGMVFAAELSRRLGFCNSSTVPETVELIEAAGLKTEFKIDGVDEILGIMARDKKNTENGLTFVLLEEFGRPVVKKVSIEDVASLLKEKANE